MTISTVENLKRKAQRLPSNPGVYFFLNKSKKILYIGKAASLRERIKSYFSKDLEESRGPLLVKMLNEARSIDFRKTSSVLEALILEADLIKKFKPEYNSIQKDDKSFNHVIITNEQFPKVLLVRGKDLKLKTNSWKPKANFGPFPHGLQLQSALKIIRKIFPYFDNKCHPEKPTLSGELGLCPIGISKRDYAETIKNIRLFFGGKKRDILKNLKKEMNILARKEEFEKANELKKTIFALEHIRDVSLIKKDELVEAGTFRIEGYDVSHTSGEDTVGVMTVIENGRIKKSDYRQFNIKSAKASDDVGALHEMVARRLNHREWPLPDLIVVDGSIAQKRAVEKALKESAIITQVVSVTKDKSHKPKSITGSEKIIKANKDNILLVNSEAHRFSLKLHRQKRGKF